MKKRILITGGAGFIGHHFLNTLERSGHYPIVVDNLSTGLASNVPNSCHLVVADLNDLDLTQFLVTHQITHVVHLAARVSVRDSVGNFLSDFNANALTTVKLVESAIKSKAVKKFIFSSSMAVYPECEKRGPIPETTETSPISPYGISKETSEKYIKCILGRAEIDWNILRFFNTFGPGQTESPYVGVVTTFFNKLKRREKITVYGDGSQVRDFIYVKDLVNCLAETLSSSSKSGVFNIGSGLGSSVKELAVTCCEIFGLNPEEWIEYADRRPEEVTYSVADNSKAKQHLCLNNSVTLSAYLKSISSNVEGAISLS